MKKALQTFTSQGLLVTTFLLLGLACSENDTENGSEITNQARVLKDQAGRSVHVNHKINRVVTLMPNLTELVYEVGGGSKLVASALADSYPPEVEQLPRYNSLPLDHEKMVVYQPDLVLAVEGLNNIQDADKLEQLGISSFYLRFESLSDIAESMTTIGELLGTSDQAEKARQRFEGRISPSEMGPMKVLVVNGLEVLYSFGSRSFISETVEAAGATLLSNELDANAVVLSDEFVIGQNPDLIVLASAEQMSTEKLLAERPSWRHLKAVKNNNFYTLHPDILLRPGPRIGQAVDSLKLWLKQDTHSDKHSE